MNRVYRTVFNRALGVWQVAAETAKRHGKGSGTASRAGVRRLGGLSLVALSALVVAPDAWSAMAAANSAGLSAGTAVASQSAALSAQALPGGGAVSAGSGSIAQSGAAMTITQNSQNLAINWQSFNIGKDASVTFVQPDSSAIALNRVLGSDPSQILGKLGGNGQVWVLNPNGVLFGSSAQVSVGGLVASTLGLSDADFLAGKRTFSGSGGSVLNQGSIDAGYVALLGESVGNEGVIVAQLGTVALAAGNAVTLDFDGDALLSVQVDEGALHAQADNSGLIQADGGTVLMTAQARDALLDTAVNNTGVIRARSMQNRDGRILLLGDMDSGTVNVAGTLDASAPDGGDGGFVETSAAHVAVDDNATITTRAASGSNGQWLIDPVDFTVAASGGDMTGAALTAALANGDVVIQSSAGASGSSGNVDIEDTVSWSANTLTLDAQNDINVYRQMDASGTAGLFFKYGQADAGGSYNIYAPVNLASTSSFQTQSGSTGGVTNWIILTSLGAEGSTTGTDLQGMSGNLSGNYVLGADIDASSTASWDSGAGFVPIAGSDGSIYFTGNFDGLGHVIDGLTINRPTNSVANYGLFGAASDSTFANVGLTNVSILGGTQATGGLVGRTLNVTVRNSYVTGSVTGASAVGGIVGVDISARGSTALDHVWSAGTVTATAAYSGATFAGIAGGLIGQGGLSITNSYSTADVRGGNYVGGLVGLRLSGLMDNSYFAGSIGLNDASVAAGATSAYAMGALVGEFYGMSNTVTPQITNSHWNTDTAGTVGVGLNSNNKTITSTVTGLTTAEMQDAANWTGFNFTTTPSQDGWVLFDGVLPLLASEWSTYIRNAHQLQLMGLDLSASYVLANDIDASDTDGKDVWLGSSFSPVGDATTPFTGSFDGQGHAIDGLTIDRATQDGVGLFGYANATLANVDLIGGSITGKDYVGALVGYLGSAGAISNSSASSAVSGANRVGGLAGVVKGDVDNSHATGSVTGSGNDVGGLLGVLSNGSALSSSYASGNVAGAEGVGGLVGASFSSSINNSYASGNAAGTQYVGGLVGENGSTGINNSYATGDVQAGGSGTAGGLVGHNNLSDASSPSNISNSYATGEVSGGVTGGLVGNNMFSITGTLVSSGTISNSFWSIEGTGQTSSDGGGTGLDSAQMQQLATFLGAGWDISDQGGESTIWRIYEGSTTPLLRSFLTAVTVSADLSGAGKTYDGSIASGTVANYDTDIAVDAGQLLGTLAYTSDSANAGTYSTSDGTLSLGGLYSGQQGYDISYADGSLTIGKASATVTANSASATYNGQAQSVTGYVVDGLVGSDDESVISGLTETGGSGRNAGSYTHSVVGGSADNYTLTYVDGSLDIAKAALTVTTTAVTKTYDGTTSAAGTAVVSGGQLFGTDTISGGDFAYTDKNAGTGKTVTVSDVTVDDGNGGDNYAVTYVDNTDSTITKAQATVTANSASTTYNGQAQSVTGYTVSGLVDNEDAGVLTGLAETGGEGRNAGTYAHGVTGSDGNYDLTFVDGTLTIAKAALSIGTSDVAKTYDGTTDADGTAIVVGGQLFGTDTISGGDFAYTDKNAGTGKTVTVSDVTIDDGNGGGNYAVTYVDNTTSTIDKASVTVGGSFAVADKTADGLVDASITSNALTLDGVFGGDVVAADWQAVFADAQVGVDKLVTLSGTTLIGTDSANYVLDLAGAPTALGNTLRATPVPYAGAVESAHVAMADVDETASAVHTQGPDMPGLVVAQCGQRLPAYLTKDCRR